MAQLLGAQAICAEDLGADSRASQIGTMSPTTCHRCDVSVFPRREVADMGPSDVREEGGRDSTTPPPPPPPLTIAEKNPFLSRRTDFFSCGACRNYFFLFCSTFRFNLEKLSIRRDAAIPVSPTFLIVLLELHFVIDAAVKQLVSRSFLKCGVSAVTMVAHNFFFLNRINSSLYSFHYRPTRCRTEAW